MKISKPIFGLFLFLGIASFLCQAQSQQEPTFVFQGDDFQGSGFSWQEQGQSMLVLTQDDATGSFVWFGNGANAYLAIGAVEMTPELRAHFGAPEDAGILISKVNGDGAGQKAGLKVGDILLRIAGTAVTSPHMLPGKVLEKHQGEEVTLEILRDGNPLSLQTVLELPPSTPQAYAFGSGLSPDDNVFFYESGKGQSKPLKFVEIPDPDLHKKIEKLENRLQELEKHLKALERERR